MAIKRLEAIYKFLQAAKNLIKNKDMSKEGILRFAKQEFGEVSDFLRLQIDNLFRKPKVLTSADKTYKQELRRLEGALGSLDPKQPGFKEAADRLIKKIEDLQKTRKADVVPIKKQEGIVRRPEEFATRKEYERYLDEILGPSDDVFGSPMKDDLLKKWDKVNAKNVTPDIKQAIDEKEGDDFIDFVRKQGDEEGANKIQKEVDRINEAIDKADKNVEATKILTKRTDDIASGDPTGEVSEGIESLGTNMKKLREAVEELKKVSQDTTPGGIMKEIMKGQKVMAEGYKKGNIRTAVRWFMRQEADAGKLKLSKDDYDALQVYAQTSEGDPINIFRRYYGEDALQQIDEIGDVFSKGESFNHYAQLLRENVHPSVLTPKTKGLGQYDPDVLTPKQEEELRRQLLKDQEQKQMLEDFDPTDRTKNAHGGLIDILKL